MPRRVRRTLTLRTRVLTKVASMSGDVLVAQVAIKMSAGRLKDLRSRVALRSEDSGKQWVPP
jgi:hypothetical protein